MSLRPVSAFVLVALVAGAIAARADSGGALPPPPRLLPRAAPPTVPAPAASIPPAVVPFARGCAVLAPFEHRSPAPSRPAAAPPSKALLDAFSVLRRERRDEDALSPEALEALRRRGLVGVAPESARLLRTTPSGGRAWVVPVPDLALALPFLCARAGKRGPQEGVAVVSEGDAASGGGGALDDLVRGLAPVTVAPCAAADHAMLSISGVVPDGVQAVFHRAGRHRGARRRRETATSSCLRPRARSSSATSCGPGATGRLTSSRWSPTAAGGPSIARPSRRCPRHGCRPMACASRA